MRISADQDEASYNAAALYCEAYLDGVKLNHCITADEERGEAICFVSDSEGKLITEDGTIRREVRKGRVEVRSQDGAPDWVKEALRG